MLCSCTVGWKDELSPLKLGGHGYGCGQAGMPRASHIVWSLGGDPILLTCSQGIPMVSMQQTCRKSSSPGTWGGIINPHQLVEICRSRFAHRCVLTKVSYLLVKEPNPMFHLSPMHPSPHAWIFPITHIQQHYPKKWVLYLTQYFPRSLNGKPPHSYYALIVIQ